MLNYIIQTIAFQLIFLLVYDLFLKKETFFNYNRLYLLSTSVVSFVLPLITIEGLSRAIPQRYIIKLPEVVIGSVGPENEVNNTLLNQTNAFSWLSLNTVLFIGIGIAFGFFIYRVVKIGLLVSKNSKNKTSDVTIVQLKNTNTAFSFFKYIFLGDQLSTNEKTNIIQHEHVHVKQYHTLDLLWFELLKIIFWFNPLVYMFQNRISNLHEFIADKEALKDNSKTNYYEQLLQQVFDVKQFSFINPFFKKSLIKKRIIMLSKTKSKQVNLIKYMLLIPIIIGMMIYSSCAQQDTALPDVATIEAGQEIPFYIKEIKQQIAKQGNISEGENKGLELLLASVKGEEFDPNLVKEVHDFIGKKGKTTLEKKIAQLFDHIQKVGNISNEDEKAIKGLLILTAENAFNDPFFKEQLETVEIPFAVIEKAPIFPGCESSEDAEASVKCFEKSMRTFVLKNFSTKLAEELGLNGEQRIVSQFKIDKNGNITNIKVRAPHPKLEEETTNMLKLLPKMTPGEHKGKKVIVPYMLPIKFEIKE